MKRLLFLILLLPCLVYGQTVGIKVAAPIIKNSPSDNTVTGYADLLNGGYHITSTISGRDSLNTAYSKTLKTGMLCYVTGVDSTYRWSGTDWTAVLSGGITPEILSDSLSNYTPLQDGLISGGSATIGTGSVTIDTAYYRIDKVNYTSLPRTFTGISNSASGTQYYILIYGKNDNTLDTLQGVQDTIATIPTKPDGTVSINTVLVGDGGVESAAPDFSGYAKTDGSNTNASSFRSALDLSTYYVSKTVSDTKTGNLSINGNLSSISSIRTTGYDNPGYSSGKGIEFRYDTANDRGSFLSYDRDNNIAKPLIFEASVYLFGSSIGTSRKVGINVNPPAYDLDVKGDVNIGSGSVYRINGIALSYENPLTFASPLSRSTNTISIPPATTSANGYLTSTDWNTFKDKQDALGFTPANIDGSNITQSSFRTALGLGSNAYSSTAYLPLTGGTLSDNLLISSGYGSGFKLEDGFGILRQAGYTGFNYGNVEKLKLSSTGLDVNGTGYFSNKLSLSAGTTSNSSFKMPNGVAPTTPVSGDWWSLTTGSRTQTYDGTQTKDVIFDKANSVFAGLGTGMIATNNSGDLSVVPIADRLTTNVITKTANYTVTLSDVGANGEVLVMADATSGNITITLPVASTSTGLNFIVKKTDSSVNTVTVSVASTIDGASTKVYSTQYSGGRITSNGTSYSITGAF